MISEHDSIAAAYPSTHAADTSRPAELPASPHRLSCSPHHPAGAHPSAERLTAAALSPGILLHSDSKCSICTTMDEEEKDITAIALQKINKLEIDLAVYVNQIDSSVVTKNSKEYKVLDEMITRILEQLDGIQSNNCQEIICARKAVVRAAHAALNRLEEKSADSTPADTTGRTIRD